jgi:hypothetical protein
LSLSRYRAIDASWWHLLECPLRRRINQQAAYVAQALLSNTSSFNYSKRK